MKDCNCGKEFEATDGDGVLYCTNCTATKGLAAGRREPGPSKPIIGETGDKPKEDPPAE